MASREEIINENSLAAARARAFKLLDVEAMVGKAPNEMAHDTQVYWGAQRWNKDLITGFEVGEAHDRKLFRFDYDERHGLHINLDIGKGTARRKYCIRFPGVRDDFDKIVARLSRPSNKNGREIFANICQLPDQCPINP